MARCNCAGNTCGCKVQAGTGGISVAGIGTAADPFKVSLDDSSIAVGSRISLDDSTTVELSVVGDGTGTPADPLILRADIVLRSPNGTRYTLAVSNAGALSAVAL